MNKFFKETLSNLETRVADTIRLISNEEQVYTDGDNPVLDSYRQYLRLLIVEKEFLEDVKGLPNTINENR